jgi:hypothetical protein
MRGNERSLIVAIRGPVTLITLGVLFALNNFTEYRFHQTWPVLLIVFGLLSLARRGMEPAPTVPPPPYMPPPPPPPYNPSTASGGFRQSTYNEPPSPSTQDAHSRAKGGFGSTAGENQGGGAV